MTAEVEPYAHLRPATGAVDVPMGVYRVVGTGDPVALLRVTNADGLRTNTGRVERVPRERVIEAFEPAANPDPTGPLGRLRSILMSPIETVRNRLG